MLSHPEKCELARVMKVAASKFCVQNFSSLAEHGEGQDLS